MYWIGYFRLTLSRHRHFSWSSRKGHKGRTKATKAAEKAWPTNFLSLEEFICHFYFFFLDGFVRKGLVKKLTQTSFPTLNKGLQNKLEGNGTNVEMGNGKALRVL